MRDAQQQGNGVVSERPPKAKLRSLFKTHLHDWIILLALIIFYGLLNLIEPFHRYINKFMVANISYPFKHTTVPFWSVPLYALVLPVIIFCTVFCFKRNVLEAHHAIHGLLYTCFVTAVLTDILKVSTGRPRPDFLSRCFPEGFDKWTFNDAGDGNVICSPNAIRADVKEGYKSFPSGHTSWSFAGLGYLSWYLAGKFRLYDKAGHTYKVAISLFPLLVATLVGISLVNDYWHHWTDVFVGGLLGLAVASIIYHLHFPPIFGPQSGAPFILVRPSTLRAMNAGSVAAPDHPPASDQPPADIESGISPRS